MVSLKSLEHPQNRHWMQGVLSDTFYLRKYIVFQFFARITKLLSIFFLQIYQLRFTSSQFHDTNVNSCSIVHISDFATPTAAMSAICWYYTSNPQIWAPLTKVYTVPVFCKKYQAIASVFSGARWDSQILNCINKFLTLVVYVKSWTNHFSHNYNWRHLLVSAFNAPEIIHQWEKWDLWIPGVRAPIGQHKLCGPIGLFPWNS